MLVWYIKPTNWQEKKIKLGRDSFFTLELPRWILNLEQNEIEQMPPTLACACRVKINY